MRILKAYVLFCVCCVPFMTYEPEYTEPEQQELKEIVFWCDCGAIIHWKDMMLEKY